MKEQLPQAAPKELTVPIHSHVHAVVHSHMLTELEEGRGEGAKGGATVTRRPSFTPSIGSKNSDHEALMNTVEVAAYFSRSSLRYSKRRLRGLVRILLQSHTTAYLACKKIIVSFCHSLHCRIRS